MSGQIVDATIISAPRQKMTQEEKEKVKEGEIPEEWKAKPSKLAQKDRDARWVVKPMAIFAKGFSAQKHRTLLSW